MKLAPLLAQYFYLHRQLDLPALGRFVLDPSIIIDQENNKSNKAFILEGVSFIANPSIPEDPLLLEYISSHTGKIRALASADLASHLELALQFLHIGKPFLFEGIAVLTKTSPGEFSLSPATAINGFIKDNPVKPVSADDNKVTGADYKSILYLKKNKNRYLRPVTLLLVLGGMAVAVWGGYKVYEKGSADKKEVTETVEPNMNTEPVQEIVARDTTVNTIADTSLNSTATSTLPAAVITNTAPGSYKFILEKTNMQRALARVNRLKSFQWNVNLETADSVSYTIYMQLPVSPMDTTRVIDSLSRLTGKKVYISL